MKDILYVTSQLSGWYEKDGILNRIKDNLNVKLRWKREIKELGITLINSEIPPNLNKRAYNININKAKGKFRAKDMLLSPNVYRPYDYYLYNSFQKRLFSYSVVRSLELLLKSKGKNSKNASILIYDAKDHISADIALEAAKAFKCIILLSEDYSKIRKLSDYIGANVGTIPIITRDFNYALREADCIILSSKLEICETKRSSIVWHIDNSEEENSLGIHINSVSYVFPLKETLELGSETVGAILCQMGQRDVERSLKDNGIFLEKIKFNGNVL